MYYVVLYRLRFRLDEECHMFVKIYKIYYDDVLNLAVRR